MAVTNTRMKSLYSTLDVHWEAKNRSKTHFAAFLMYLKSARPKSNLYKITLQRF